MIKHENPDRGTSAGLLVAQGELSFADTDTYTIPFWLGDNVRRELFVEFLKSDNSEFLSSLLLTAQEAEVRSAEAAAATPPVNEIYANLESAWSSVQDVQKMYADLIAYPDHFTGVEVDDASDEIVVTIRNWPMKPTREVFELLHLCLISGDSEEVEEQQGCAFRLLLDLEISTDDIQVKYHFHKPSDCFSTEPVERLIWWGKNSGSVKFSLWAAPVEEEVTETAMTILREHGRRQG